MSARRRRPAYRGSGDWLRTRAGGALPSHMIGRNAEASRYDDPVRRAEPASYAPAASDADYGHESDVARYIAAIRSSASL